MYNNFFLLSFPLPVHSCSTVVINARSSAALGSATHHCKTTTTRYDGRRVVARFHDNYGRGFSEDTARVRGHFGAPDVPPTDTHRVGRLLRAVRVSGRNPAGAGPA